MPTLIFLTLLIFCISAFPYPAPAQQPGKIFHIGFLDPTNASDNADRLEAFRQELKKLGWIEGKNIAFEYRFAENKPGRGDELAAELVRLKVDLIVTSGTPPALAAKKATTTIPIIIGNTDPVALGLVDSLARPGGNITGFATLASDLNTKRLEMLTEAVPKLDRVGLLRSTSGSNPGEELQLKELRAAAPALKVTLEEMKTQFDAQGLENAFKTAEQKQVRAIMTTSLRLFTAHRKRIVALAGKYRLPGIYGQRAYVDEGGLMSYGLDRNDIFRRKAVYADKILRGAKPADLPVQQATKIEFIINLKAAKQIGLVIPPNVLARADRIIK